MKRVISSILVVLLLMSLLAGCYKDTDVLVIDGYPIYPGLYLYFQLQALSMASQKFENEYAGKELYEQTIDDMSVTDWIYMRTVELAQEFVFIEKSFERLELDPTGLELEMNYYEATLRDEWSMMNYFYTKNGIGYTTFRKAYENFLKSNQLFSALFVAEDGEEAVPEKEIKDFFEKNYTYLDYIRINKVDDEDVPLTETKIKKIIKDAEKMRDCAEDTVEEEGVLFIYPENIGLQAAFIYYCEINELTEDEMLDVKGKMLTEHTIVKPTSTIYEEEFLVELFEAKYDNFFIYDAEDSVYIYCRRSMLGFNDDSWLDYRDTMIAEMRTDTYLDYLEEHKIFLSVTENKGARRYFNLKKASL